MPICVSLPDHHGPRGSVAPFLDLGPGRENTRSSRDPEDLQVCQVQTAPFDPQVSRWSMEPHQVGQSILPPGHEEFANTGRTTAAAQPPQAKWLSRLRKMAIHRYPPGHVATGSSAPCGPTSIPRHKGAATTVVYQNLPNGSMLRSFTNLTENMTRNRKPFGLYNPHDRRGTTYSTQTISSSSTPTSIHTDLCSFDFLLLPSAAI